MGNVGTASASASALASANAFVGGSDGAADLKHVEVIVSSDVPVDVSIMDDNADWILTEEINGTKTYENDIDSNSGLVVDASRPEDVAPALDTVFPECVGSRKAPTRQHGQCRNFVNGTRELRLVDQVGVGPAAE